MHDPHSTSALAQQLRNLIRKANHQSLNHPPRLYAMAEELRWLAANLERLATQKLHVRLSQTRRQT
jgi:hypothetical protein